MGARRDRLIGGEQRGAFMVHLPICDEVVLDSLFLEPIEEMSVRREVPEARPALFGDREVPRPHVEHRPVPG